MVLFFNRDRFLTR